MKRSLIFFSLIFFLYGCSILPSKPTSTFNHPLSKLTNIPENLINRTWLERFSIDIQLTKQNNIHQELLLRTEFTTTHINIVMLSLDGIALAQAQWNSQTQTLKVERILDTPLTKQLDIKKVFHDLQAAHWPVKKLKEVLSPEYSFSEETVNGIKIRRFFYQNKVIIVIRKKAAQISLEYINAGYQIKMSRLQDSQLKPPLKKK